MPGTSPASAPRHLGLVPSRPGVEGQDEEGRTEDEEARYRKPRFAEHASRPRDQDGNDDTNSGRNKPYDWVMPNDSLNDLHVSVALGSETFPTGLVFDTRVYTPLSEAPPALSDDSAALNMQHMAVVKDFAIPGTETNFTVSSDAVNFGEVDALDFGKSFDYRRNVRPGRHEELVRPVEAPAPERLGIGRRSGRNRKRHLDAVNSGLADQVID